jgi:3-oxoacyl-[acyl-carrier-protein] synthase-3
VADGADALRRLVAQVTRPVRWDACQATLRELGVTALDRAAAGRDAGRAGPRELKGVRTLALKTPTTSSRRGTRHRARAAGSSDERPAAAHRGVAGARLLGLGSFQPDRVVTNDELAARVDTSDEWIRSRVGIESRRIADKDTHLVDMAAEAGARALKDSGLEPAEIGAVIVATCTMLDNIPNTAAQVAHRIGITAPAAFDLNTACSGFSYGLAVAADLVRAGTVRHVLVIGAEKLSDWMDWDDRSTCIIFADGAGAAVVGAAPDEESVGVGPGGLGQRGRPGADDPDQPDTRALHQEGQAVFRWATTKVAPVALRAIELAGLTPADVDVLVPHQANLRIVEAVAKRMRAKGCPRRHARRRRHRALGQHVVGLDPAGPGPHARAGPPPFGRDRGPRRLRRGAVVRGPVVVCP